MMPPTGFLPLRDGSVALFGQVRHDPKVATDRPTAASTYIKYWPDARYHSVVSTRLCLGEIIRCCPSGKCFDTIAP